MCIKGNILLLTQKFRLAIATYTAVVELDPNCLTSHLGLVDCFLSLDCSHDALKYAAIACEISSSDFRCYVQLAKAAMQAGDYKLAATNFETAYEKQPSNSDYMALSAIAHVELAKEASGDVSLALRLLQNAHAEIMLCLANDPKSILGLQVKANIEDNIDVLDNFAKDCIPDCETSCAFAGKICEILKNSELIFSYHDLLTPGPFPQEVDSTRREIYLQDEEFQVQCKLHCN